MTLGTFRRTGIDGLIELAHTALRAKYGRQMWLGDMFARLTGRLSRGARNDIEV
jgi:hypothetical protein